MGIEQEGSIAFRLHHADPDWSTNDKAYRFTTVEVGDIRAWAMKRADRTVEFHVSGPLHKEVVLDGRMPPVGEEGLHVVVTWSAKDINLYLNARPAAVIPLPTPKTGGTPDA